MKFNTPKVLFGGTPSDGFEDDGTGLPEPTRIKMKVRRMAGLKEAKQVLQHLPGPGESVHAICTARMDLTDVIAHLIEHHGRADSVSIASLAMNMQNLKAMLGWLDTKAAGSITLCLSLFWRAHKTDLWEETLAEFRERGQRTACCHSHAKVVTLAFASGVRLSLEGSANLCGNGSGREQFAIINDAGLHDWHAAWIGELVTKHEGRDAAEKASA